MSRVAPERFLGDLVQTARVRAQKAARDPRLADVTPRVPAERGRLSRSLSSRMFGVIAESKQRSPSAGVLEQGVYDPAARARLYEEAGAAAMSVLTEPEFFGGSLEHLRAARAATSLPLLRKDFLFHPAQVAEALRCGADAVLAIVRILDDAALSRLIQEGDRLGLDVLVEVHGEGELARAVRAGASLIGVNNRDLDTFVTDWERCLRLAPLIPPGVVAVAESGIRTLDQAKALHRAGFRAILVGEAIMTAGTGLLGEVTAWTGS